MGKILSVLKGEEQEEKAKQDLEILQKLVDAKLNQFQSELNESVHANSLLLVLWHNTQNSQTDIS